MDAIVKVLDNLRNLLMLVIGSLSLVMLTVGGIRYVAAGGDPEGIRAAKHTVRNSLLGFGVALMAPVLVQVVKTIVGA